MTTKQFLAKYPDTHTCSSNMTDLACPKCGQRDHLLVRSLLFVGLTDNGTDAYSDATRDCGDTEWDDASDARCPECDYEGTVGHFTFNGLDELIEGTRNEKRTR